MAPAVIIAGASLAVAAVGTASSISSQKKQAKFQKKANQAQRAQDNLRAARERKEAIRAARASRGMAQQAAVNQGAEGSSVSLGGLGSIDSQLGSNLSFLDQFNSLSDQASVSLGKANQHGANAQTASAVAGFGMTVFSNSQGISDTVFGKGK